MEKKHALFIALAITGIIAGNWLFFYDWEELSRESVVISRVIDGDTVELEDGRVIRMLNINTEEKGRSHALEASEFLKEYLNESLELEVSGVGKYGRILGKLYKNDLYLNLELVRLGLAHKYIVKDNELGVFTDIEKKAREEELGIWERSEYDGCLDVEINKKDEVVVIKDNCGLNFNGWTLKDESTKQFKFERDFGNEFVLLSNKGESVGNEIYWGRGNVWNDENDAIFIRDSSGFLVYYDSYGY
jgi:endonuclease YncB( thermonuclease family)